VFNRISNFEWSPVIDIINFHKKGPIVAIQLAIKKTNPRYQPIADEKYGHVNFK
jgi:hypothetical protein